MLWKNSLRHGAPARALSIDSSSLCALWVLCGGILPCPHCAEDDPEHSENYSRASGNRPDPGFSGAKLHLMKDPVMQI